MLVTRLVASGHKTRVIRPQVRVSNVIAAAFAELHLSSSNSYHDKAEDREFS